MKIRCEKLMQICEERVSISNDYFQEFSQKTGLHAVHYVGDHGKSVMMRLFWLLAIMTSLTVSFYLIFIQWKKWNDTPVIVSLSETPTSIWNIPFPAVTICPENKVKYQDEFNFTELFSKKNKTVNEQQIYNQLLLLCNSNFSLREVYKTSQDSVSKINFSTNYIEKFAPKLSDIMITCVWMDAEHDCEELFKPVMTDEGLCYTFNSMNSEEMLTYSEWLHGDYLNGSRTNNWTLEDGYTKSEKVIKHPYPRRSRRPGEKGGLSILLKSNEKDYERSCRWPVFGFKVILQNPADYPRPSSNFFRVSLKKDVVATIDADIITSSAGVAQYSIEDRGCVFQYESPLRYFKNYTMSNCEIECLVNKTIDVCECIPFYFPGLENTQICARNNPCPEWITDNLDGGDLMMECLCYPSCQEVSYKARVSQASLVVAEVFRHIDESRLKDSKIFGRLSIYYQDIQFITSRRSELFGYTDFLANCGGLLGLCCGFSVLSAVEIMYFLSLCLWGGRRKKYET